MSIVLAERPARRTLLSEMRLYKRGGTYWIDYGEFGRERVRASTHTKDPDVANALFARAKLDALADRAALITRVRRLVSAFTVEDARKEWVQWARGRKEASTIERYEAIFKTRLTARFGKLRIDHVDREIEPFMSERIQEGAKPATIQLELACLSAVLQRQVKRKPSRLASNPVRDLEPLKDNKPRTFRFFSPEEYEALVTAAGEPMKSIIIVAVETGMRRSEIMHLRWDWIDFDAARHGVIHIDRTADWKPKNGEGRTVPLTARAKRAIQNMEARSKLWSEYVFPGRDGGPLRHLESQWIRLRKAVGLLGARHARFHDARHTFASNATMRGVPPRTIQAMMGHRSIVMTERYSHLAPTHLAHAVDLLEGEVQIRHTPTDTSRTSSK